MTLQLTLRPGPGCTSEQEGGLFLYGLGATTTTTGNAPPLCGEVEVEGISLADHPAPPLLLTLAFSFQALTETYWKGLPGIPAHQQTSRLESVIDAWEMRDVSGRGGREAGEEGAVRIPWSRALPLQGLAPTFRDSGGRIAYV
jgi:hypothetical protein